MLYVAFAKNAGQFDSEDVKTRARAWWNEGGRPEGLRTLGSFRLIGGAGVDVVYIFETDSHEDLREAVAYWRGIVDDFDIRPAFDALQEWRAQGMDVG